jgi:hypothetical protein
MSNLYTSELLTVATDPVEILIDRITIDAQNKFEVSKFSAQNELIGVIIPPIAYIENGGCAEDKTRIRVYLSEGQVAAGEKIQVKLDTL